MQKFFFQETNKKDGRIIYNVYLSNSLLFFALFVQFFTQRENWARSGKTKARAKKNTQQENKLLKSFLQRLFFVKGDNQKIILLMSSINEEC